MHVPLENIISCGNFHRNVNKEDFHQEAAFRKEP